ncbi:Bax inhibitor-1 family protein [Trichothermofontia sp.]
MEANRSAVQCPRLGIYVVGRALISSLLLYIAAFAFSDRVISTTWVLNLLLSAGLVVIAFISKRHFSFLVSIVIIAGCMVLGLMICDNRIFNSREETLIAVGVVALGAAVILYKTRRIIHRYTRQDDIAASLELAVSMDLVVMVIVYLVILLVWAYDSVPFLRQLFG